MYRGNTWENAAAGKAFLKETMHPHFGNFEETPWGV
jgi:hypothetical protein